MGTVSKPEDVENVPVISCLEFQWNKPIIIVIGISIYRALGFWKCMCKVMFHSKASCRSVPLHHTLGWKRKAEQEWSGCKRNRDPEEEGEPRSLPVGAARTNQFV